MINKFLASLTEEVIAHANFAFTPADISAAPVTFKLTGTMGGGVFDQDNSFVTGCTVGFTADLAKLP